MSRITILAAAVALSTSSLAADRPAAGDERVFIYDSVVGPGGDLAVRLSNPPEPKPSKLLKVYAPDADQVRRLVRTQDWYLKIDVQGRARGLYTVPSGNALSSNVVRGLAEGQSLLKVTPQSSFLKVFPTASEMTQDVADFATATRDAVCGLGRRPRSVRARIDVKPGWSANGTIRLDATWDVGELCAKPDKAQQPAKVGSGALKVVPAKARLRKPAG